VDSKTMQKLGFVVTAFALLYLVSYLAPTTGVMAQPNTLPGVIPISPGGADATPIFIDPTEKRLCIVTGYSPENVVNTACSPVQIPSGATIVALNPDGRHPRFFAIGSGKGNTIVCVVSGFNANNIAQPTCSTI